MGWLPVDPQDAQDTITRRTSGELATSETDPSTPTLGQSFGQGAKNVGMLGMQGFARAARGLDLAAGAVPVMADAVRNTLRGTSGTLQDDRSLGDAYFDRLMKPANEVVNFWTPDARTTGPVSNVSGGFLRMGTEATVGGGAGLVMAEQTNTALDLVDKGVDASTANLAGVASGASNALGLNMGIVGSTLLTRMVSGAAGNVAVNTATAVSQRATLDAAGYREQGKEFNAFDPEARAIDVLVGIAAGAITHATLPRGTTAQVDAALTAAAANRAQTSSTPARPVDAAGQQAHADAFDASIAAVVRGERVDVSNLVRPEDFIGSQPNPGLAPVVQAARTIRTLSNLTGVKKTIADAATTAGVDPQLAIAIAQIESNLKVNAQTPINPATGKRVSTAAGLGQFLDETWRSMGGTGANRFSEVEQSRVLAEFTAKNTDDLRTAIGREPAAEEVYLAHLLGMGGAKKVLRADRTTPIADLVGQAIADGNGMKGMSVAQAIEHWREKLSHAGAEPTTAARPTDVQRSADAVGTPVDVEAQTARVQAALDAIPEHVADVVPLAREVQAETPGGSVGEQAAPRTLTGEEHDFNLARAHAEAYPDMLVDHNGEQVPARQAHDAMQAELEEATSHSALYEVAANCALRFGQ